VARLLGMSPVRACRGVTAAETTHEKSTAVPTTTRRILTVHSPIRPDVLDQLLSSIEESLVGTGAERVWIDPQSTHDLTVLAEFEDAAESVPQPRAEGETELSETQLG